jgi:hypothetical protein
VSKRYQLNDEVLRLVPDIRQRGCLDFRDLIKIGAWKSAIVTATLSLNESECVCEVTRQALKCANAGDVRQAIEHLCKLEGVAIPVASAILAVVFYPNFPVLDKNAYYALHGTEFDRYDPQVYVDYFVLVSRFAKQEGISRKEMDEKLMEMGKRKQRYAGL